MEKFNFYVPILMSVICVFSLFNVSGRLLKLCGVDSLFDERKDTDDAKANEGRGIIENARRHEERRIQRGETGDGESNGFSVLGTGKAVKGALKGDGGNVERTNQVGNQQREDKMQNGQLKARNTGKLMSFFKPKRGSQWQKLDGNDEEDGDLLELPERDQDIRASFENIDKHKRHASAPATAQGQGQQQGHSGAGQQNHKRSPTDTNQSDQQKRGMVPEKMSAAMFDAKKYAAIGKSKGKEIMTGVAKTVNDKIGKPEPAPIISQSFGREVQSGRHTQPHDKAAALLVAASTVKPKRNLTMGLFKDV